jgi:hypothetical protein
MTQWIQYGILKYADQVDYMNVLALRTLVIFSLSW